MEGNENLPEMKKNSFSILSVNKKTSGDYIGFFGTDPTAVIFYRYRTRVRDDV